MDIQSRIDEFEELEEGWNGYNNCPPIPEPVVNRSRRFADALEDRRSEAEVFPTGRETIQFEFEDMEIEIFETFVEILHESTFGDEPNVFSLTLEEAIEKYTGA